MSKQRMAGLCAAREACALCMCGSQRPDTGMHRGCQQSPGPATACATRPTSCWSCTRVPRAVRCAAPRRRCWPRWRPCPCASRGCGSAPCPVSACAGARWTPAPAMRSIGRRWAALPQRDRASGCVRCSRGGPAGCCAGAIQCGLGAATCLAQHVKWGWLWWEPCSEQQHGMCCVGTAACASFGVSKPALRG